MTVTNTTSSITIEGDGATTTFDFNFEIPFLSDGVTPASRVFTSSAGVVTILVLNTDYSITGVGDSFPNGGSVSYPLVGSPLAMGFFITIQRDLPPTQPYAFPNLNFLPQQVENALDYLVFIIQQISTGGVLLSRSTFADLPSDPLLGTGVLLLDGTVWGSGGTVVPGGGGTVQVPILFTNLGWVYWT